MLDYMILRAGIRTDLEHQVKEAIGDGWQPIGGVAVVVADQYFNKRFYQAMVKEDRNLFAEKLKAAQRRGLTLDQAIANAMGGTLEEANAEES